MKTPKQLLATIVIILGCHFHIQAQTFLTNGLVAYYPFNGNANDASGNANNGTINQTDWKISLDRFGNTNSLFLNLTSTPAFSTPGAYVSVPKSGLLNFNSNFTFSVWVDFTNTNPLPNATPEGFVHNILSDGADALSVNFRIFTDYAPGIDKVQFLWGGANSSINVLVNSVRNTWQQFTVMKSGASLALYRNGIFLTNGLALPTVNTSGIWLGRHQNSTPYPLFGGIDDVRMYNRALSSDEVSQLYAIESGPVVYLNRAVWVSFSGLQFGTNYQLQTSTNINGSWTNFGTPFTATNSTMNYSNYWNVSAWNQLFFRLR